MEEEKNETAELSDETTAPNANTEENTDSAAGIEKDLDEMALDEKPWQKIWRQAKQTAITRLEFVQEKWSDQDDEQRKKILIGVVIVLLLMLGVWGWRSRSLHQKNQAPTNINSNEIAETRRPSDSTNTSQNPNLPQYENNDNRVLPAVSSGDLETWSGLKKDSYEMKKRGQIKTIPQKISDLVPSP